MVQIQSDCQTPSQVFSEKDQELTLFSPGHNDDHNNPTKTKHFQVTQDADFWYTTLVCPNQMKYEEKSQDVIKKTTKKTSNLTINDTCDLNATCEADFW